MKVKSSFFKAILKLTGGVFALTLMLGMDTQAKDVTVNSADQLQSVLDEARELSETLNVTIPAGSDFTIARFLYVYPDTVIHAQGATIRNTNSAWALIATPEDAAPANITIDGGVWEAGANSFMDYTGASNVVVSGATINGSGNNIALLQNCQSVTFQDCVMNGASIQIKGGRDNAVKGGSLTGTNNAGIPSILISEGAEGTIVNGVTISDSANTAIRLEKSQNAQITANTIQNTYSIGIESVGGGHHTISDNILSNSGYRGISVAADQGSVISGNTLDGNAVRDGSNGEGLVVDENSDGTAVRGNTVKNIKGVQGTVGNGIIVNRSTNITVSDNKVSDSANHGIQVSFSSAKVTVSGNTVTNAGRMGISVSRGAQADLKGNTISGSASRGITFDGKEGTVSGSIENCTVSGSREQGIYIETANVSMSGNTIENSGAGGIAVTNSTVTADKNKVYQSTIDSKNTGILVTNDARLTMNENIISNFSAAGVYGAAGTVVDGSNNQVNISSGGFEGVTGAYSIASGIRSNTIFAYSVERTSASIETELSGCPTGAVVNGAKVENTGDRHVTVTYGDTDPAAVIVYTQDEKGNAICMQAPVNFDLRNLTVAIPDDVDVEAIQAFVGRLYTVALGRTAEEAGLEDWTNRLATGRESGAEVARGFFFSDEFRNKGMADEQFVDTLYRTMFNREADQDGKNGWLEDLHNGVSRDYVYRGFAQSDEFKNLCDKYHITQGGVSLSQPRDQNAKLTEFVSRVYWIALNRDSLDEAGINDWCGRILGGANPSDVVWGIVFSEEFTNRNLSDEDFVKVMYRTYFNREADEAGFNDWMNQLNGGASREQIVNGFSGSVEFANLVESFGL